jgi:hypothetical protein
MTARFAIIFAVLTTVVAFSPAARAQYIPYPEASLPGDETGRLEFDRRILDNDRARIASDSVSHPRRLAGDRAQLAADMAVYHRHSAEAADALNGREIITTYTSKAYYP